MLPFLKNRQEGSMSGPVDETMMRESDGEEEYGMLDAIAEDMIEAFKKSDKRMLKEALSALCEHLQEEDQTQDEELEEHDDQ